MPPVSGTSRGTSFVANSFVSRTDEPEEGSQAKVETLPQSEATTMLTPAPSLKDSIALGLGSVPDVQAVFTMHQDNIFYVWAVVSRSEPDVRRSLYIKEKELIDSFVAFDFDFSIVSSRGRDPLSVLSDPSLELAYLRA
jgi:hypothetical protein